MRKKLEQLRKERGLTQEKLSEDLGVTSDYISMIERGARNPGFKLAKKIADYFSETIDSIFLTNNRTKYSKQRNGRRSKWAN